MLRGILFRKIIKNNTPGFDSGVFAFLVQRGEDRHADDRRQSGDYDRDIADRAFDLAELHRLRRADRVAGGADRKAARERLADAQKPAKRNGRCVAEQAGDRDDRRGDRGVPARFLGDRHADGRRDGLRQERDILRMADAEKRAATLIGEGEAEYMSILQGAYNTADKAEFYNFIRSLDAMKESMTGGNKTIILDKDSQIAQLFYGVSTTD